MAEQQLTHIDEAGDVRMVDVSQKADTERVAVAEGFIAMRPETLELITSGTCEPVREGQREDGLVGIHVVTTCGVTGKTGIEMEALTAASVACLTVYDMCKAVDRGMEIMDVRLLKKDGGKTGLWERSQGRE